MPYQTAIRTLAGHGNFQRFEHFITNIALKKYRCSIVEKTIDTDSLLDVLAVSPSYSSPFGSTVRYHYIC